MKKIILASFIVFLASCGKEDADISIKQGKGNVWLSGGLANCAEQIHLDNGENLIVKIEDLISFTSGDRVIVKYKEIGINGLCIPGINCEIIEIKRE